jgi:O-methyltransferase
MVISKCILPSDASAAVSSSRNAASPKRLAATSVIKKIVHSIFRTFGLDVIKFNGQVPMPADLGREEVAIIRAVQPFTMTSPERVFALIQAVRYIHKRGIPGSVVECGVWKGGSMAAVARVLLEEDDVSRDLYLFDTFQGMTDPTSNDVDYSGVSASQVLIGDPAFKCANAPLTDVKKLLYSTGYPSARIHFIPGRVEDTIPDSAPASIALLRLDTDWYESTKYELMHLFPRLATDGVIIIDDYGHWRGSRLACDEYFEQNRIPLLLNRIDYTGRIALKP